VPGRVSPTRPATPALLMAIAIAAAIFAISFGFVADAQRSTPTAAKRRAPRHEPASPRVGLGAAPNLRVRASLLTPPPRPAPVRRVAPRRAAAAPLPSAPPADVPEQPVTQPAPVTVAPPAQRPAPKPRPKPAAKPKPKRPKPPDFDDTGPPGPGKGRTAGR
jgi:hypothetical protein